uniref:Uncharacterized protein n=1 Tax=Macrostomum lignano TaxID=282301 RepID=A0A1I8J054_9PLAT
MSETNGNNNDSTQARVSPDRPSPANQSGSLLLKRRRLRSTAYANNSSMSSVTNDNDGTAGSVWSSAFNLTQLRVRTPSSQPQSRTVSQVRSVEKRSADIAKLSLRLMLLQRLSSMNADVRERALFMMRQANCDCDGWCPQPEVSSGRTAADKTRWLARKLARFADEFGATWAGGAAARRAREMSLPQVSGKAELRHCLNHHLTGFESVRCRVAFLLILCSELAAKAVLQCNAVALGLIVGCCSELLCCHIAPIVIVRGWSYFINAAEFTRATGVGRRLLTALILIGCMGAFASRTQSH